MSCGPQGSFIKCEKNYLENDKILTQSLSHKLAVWRRKLGYLVAFIFFKSTHKGTKLCFKWSAREIIEQQLKPPFHPSFLMLGSWIWGLELYNFAKLTISDTNFMQRLLWKTNKQPPLPAGFGLKKSLHEAKSWISLLKALGWTCFNQLKAL